MDAINSRHVSAYGPGLSHGMVNKPATFTIVTKDAGEGEGSYRQGLGRWSASAGVGAGPLISAPSPPPGGLSLAVEGPSKAEITCKDNKDGTCTVSYLPTAPGDYSIIVRFDDKHIPGSPFTAKITGGWTCGHTQPATASPAHNRWASLAWSSHQSLRVGPPRGGRGHFWINDLFSTAREKHPAMCASLL